MRSCVRAYVHVSCQLPFVHVCSVLFTDYNVSWLRLICVDLFGEEWSTTFRKLDLSALFYVFFTEVVKVQLD